MKKKISDQDKSTAVLALDHKPARQIAKELKVAPSMIYTWRKNIQQYGSPSKKRGQQSKDPVADIAQDALVYLKHCENAIMRMIRDGRLKRPDPAHLYALLALQALSK